MKEFVVYTVLRLVLLAATWGVVLGVWVLITGRADIVVSLVIAFVVSGVGSWFLLDRPRAAFAARVEARAERATAAFDALRAREDEAQWASDGEGTTTSVTTEGDRAAGHSG